MSGIQRVLEVDKLLTRELNLRNPDNSTPAANLSLHTDGQGGTYLRSIYRADNPAGFNSLYLVNSNDTINANLAFNTLKIKEGPGVAIIKDKDDTVIIKAIAIVPSTFSYVSTPTGSIYAENITGTLSIIPTYGVSATVSSNSLYLGGFPGFGIVNVSTIKNTRGKISASPDISTLTIVPDFGIELQVHRPNTLVIGTSVKNYALNQITLNSKDSFNFDSKFNTLNFGARGNLTLEKGDSNTINFLSYSFSDIQTNNGNISSAIAGSSLKFLAGYGLETAVNGSELHIQSNKPAFDTIITPKGTISSMYHNTNLLLKTGYGMDLDVYGNEITFKLANHYATSIKTETVSTVATSASEFLFAAGTGIKYSNTDSGALQIATSDFNEVRVGGQRLSSENAIYKKKLRLRGLGNILVQGDPITNTVSFLLTGGLASTTGVSYAFSQVLVHSTINSVDQDTSKYPEPFILNSAPYSQATLGITGVAPIKVLPQYDFTKSSMFYITLDQDNIFGKPISSVTLSSLNMLNTLYLDKLSTVKTDIGSLNITNIESVPEKPLIHFDYKNSRVGINKNGKPPLADLDISGTVLARTYATYSDPTLKRFKEDYIISPNDLDTLKPKYFNWLEDESHDVGFSANDIERVLPEAVKIGPTGLKMVDYSKLSIVAIASLQESNKRLKVLESTIQAIQTKLL